MEIIYSDSKIIVAVKPAGVLSTDVPGGMPDLLRQAVGDEKAGIYSVHRLDAAASGLMVYARTRHAASDLGKAVQAGEVHKEYLAAVRGCPTEPVGTLTDYLGYDKKSRTAFVTDENAPDGREAVLHYAVIAKTDALSLVWIELVTGRTHQIRAQFASRGLPLLGDRKYGAAAAGEGLALWSCALSFAHPATGERLHFSLEPPRTQPWTEFDLWRKTDGR